MIYTIQNEKLKVDVTDLGAELQSIYGKTNKFEYLWQGNPEFWGGRAYVLFPICGRLFDGKYIYNGKTYQMNLHGFSRKSIHKMIEKTDTSIEFELTESPETLQQYPFRFIFRIKYLLDGAKLKTILTVINPDEQVLPFSIGGHPGFNIPLEEGISDEEHYLEFDSECKVTVLDCSSTCFGLGTQRDFPLVNDKIVNFKHSLFDNDAIFFNNIPNGISLKAKNSDRFVKVTYNDMTHLGLWHKPLSKAPFVCIEPWHGVFSTDGIVDDFQTKKELIHLQPKNTYQTFIDIEVNE